MNKAFIFGIGGFVGKYLSEELAAHGYTVSGSDIRRTENVLPEVRFSPCDILDTAAVRELLLAEKPDCIINLAAISSVGASWKMPSATVSVNVVGALNILEGARALDPMPRVMFIGSSEEYQPSVQAVSEDTPLSANNPYGISKMTQEKFAEIYRQRFGMQIYYVRPFNHTGIGQRDSFVLPSFCRQAAEIERSGKPGVIHVGNLAAKRDFGDVRDVVRAYRMIIESEDCTKVYNVGSGEAYSLSELLEYIISLSSRKIEISVDADKFRPVDTPVVLCDHRRISAELGWQPEHSIFETLKEMFLYYRDHPEK